MFQAPYKSYIALFKIREEFLEGGREDMEEFTTNDWFLQVVLVQLPYLKYFIYNLLSFFL